MLFYYESLWPGSCFPENYIHFLSQHIRLCLILIYNEVRFLLLGIHPLLCQLELLLMVMDELDAVLFEPCMKVTVRMKLRSLLLTS
ncbi:protein of unknown function [Moritella yayanosii]|uniref:Uncharacterized protein n=1 Tax=Moritella yayanosii TaxID=69539 RepID=A0A330LPK0_9GAMM|nr:protein of unknown function [Moritella yayanosii]